MTILISRCAYVLDRKSPRDCRDPPHYLHICLAVRVYVLLVACTLYESQIVHGDRIHTHTFGVKLYQFSYQAPVSKVLGSIQVREKYRSVPGKCPLPVKRPCSAFQGVTVTASIQTYGSYILGKCPCGPKLRVVFKHQWALTRDTALTQDTTVY